MVDTEDDLLMDIVVVGAAWNIFFGLKFFKNVRLLFDNNNASTRDSS